MLTFSGSVISLDSSNFLLATFSMKEMWSVITDFRYGQLLKRAMGIFFYFSQHGLWPESLVGREAGSKFTVLNQIFKTLEAPIHVSWDLCVLRCQVVVREESLFKSAKIFLKTLHWKRPRWDIYWKDRGMVNHLPIRHIELVEVFCPLFYWPYLQGANPSCSKTRQMVQSRQVYW